MPRSLLTRWRQTCNRSPLAGSLREYPSTIRIREQSTTAAACQRAGLAIRECGPSDGGSPQAHMTYDSAVGLDRCIFVVPRRYCFRRACNTYNALLRGLVIAEATRDMITDALDDFSRPPTPSRRPRRNRIRSNRPVGRKTAADIAPAPRVTRGHLKLYADRDAPEIVITMRWNSRSRCPGNHDHHAPERADDVAPACEGAVLPR
jgi:hypothetical protein